MGNELLSSKVIVQERPPGLRTIQGVPTAVTGLVALTERGPVRLPRLMTSWAEYRRIFGGYITVGRGPEAAYGFFLNGGKNLWVSRTVHYTDITDAATKTSIAATVTLKDRDAAPADTLQIDALYDGTWGNDLEIDIKDPTDGEADHFNLEVIEDSVVKEIFPNLSMTDADAEFVETIINATDGTGSELISVIDLDSASTPPTDLPALSAGTPTPLTGGDDGLASIADTDFIGDPTELTGLRAFDEVNDLRILMVPDKQNVAVQQGMEDYAEVTRGGSMFCVLSVPSGSTAAQAVTYVVTTASLLNRSEFAAIYWPWVKIVNPSSVVYGTGDDITIPPDGIIAGMYANQDGKETGGIYKAAAGVERGIPRGVIGLETDEALDERKRDLVYPQRINPIHKEPGTPIYVDGSRTLKSTGNFPSVPERRSVIFIAESVKGGIKFAKQSNNDSRLRAEVNRTITAFLLQQFRDGGFRGDTPAESFYVDTSDEQNPPSAIFAGRLHVEIGLATQKPAEFVIVTITQDTRELEEELAAAGV